MEEEQQNQNRIYSDLDITDEMRIQFAIDEFYESTKQYDGDSEKTVRLKLMRNNIINMMDTYLKKFDNPLIMNDFRNRLIKAKKDATIGNRVHKYKQYMNEIRCIQEFKGIKENIANKLAEQLIDIWRNSEVIPDADAPQNDGAE